MTQPQHPFTDLPEGAVVKKLKPIKDNYDEGWRIGNVCCVLKHKGFYRTSCYVWNYGFFTQLAKPTPNEAFQALRQAVRDLATDLGVI